MTLTTIAVDGVPLESYGVQPIALERWLAPPAVKYARVPLVSRWGQHASTYGSVYEPRTLTLGVMATGATRDASRRQFEAWYYALQGLLEIEVVDAPDIVCYGVFESGTDDVLGVKLLSPYLTVIGQIVCDNPLWYARTPVSFSAATGTPVAVPTGSAPGRMMLELIGPFTDPTITLRDRTGASLATMRFTVTGAAGDTLLIEGDDVNPGITRYVSGVASDGFGLLNVDDTFLSADPQDGPTLETSSGTLLGTAWRAYLV